MISYTTARHYQNVAALNELIDKRGLSLEDVVTELEALYADWAYREWGLGTGIGSGRILFDSFEELPNDVLADYVDHLVEDD